MNFSDAIIQEMLEALAMNPDDVATRRMLADYCADWGQEEPVICDRSFGQLAQPCFIDENGNRWDAEWLDSEEEA